MSNTDFTAYDRCDGCGAQALIGVAKHGRRLLFCGHHYAKHNTLLHAQGWALEQDERAKLLIKRESSPV